jgi:hypothetical protein
VATDAQRPRLLFLHVMKTAGTTFVQHLHANVEPGGVYPDLEPGSERRSAYRLIPLLRDYVRGGGTARAFAGHFPSAVIDIVRPDVTMTVLREPVERTISILRQHERLNERLRGASIEEIYEDGFVRPMFVQDHQAKVFAMTSTDRLESVMDVLEVDEARLELAKRNLERVDIVGLTEHYDEFLELVGERLGWPVGRKRRLNVSPEGAEIPDELRERITEDNPADIAFYQHAVELVASRRPTRTS